MKLLPRTLMEDLLTPAAEQPELLPTAHHLGGGGKVLSVMTVMMTVVGHGVPGCRNNRGVLQQQQLVPMVRMEQHSSHCQPMLQWKTNCLLKQRRCDQKIDRAVLAVGGAPPRNGLYPSEASSPFLRVLLMSTSAQT